MSELRGSRRRWIKRVALGMGAVSLGIAALAVADADRTDTRRPLFVRRLG
jgi:hypothetical protein